MARAARRWIEPFRRTFPDVHMEIVELVAEDDTVVGRFRCSGTHLGTWRGAQPTGRRFERVDEVYFFGLVDGRITSAWGIEDTRSRLRQLGLAATPHDDRRRGSQMRRSTRRQARTPCMLRCVAITTGIRCFHAAPKPRTWRHSARRRRAHCPVCSDSEDGRSRTRTWDLFLIREAL